MERRLGDGLLGFIGILQQDGPAAGRETLLVGDQLVIAAAPDVLLAQQQVGDLHRCDDVGVRPGLFGMMMKAR